MDINAKQAGAFFDRFLLAAKRRVAMGNGAMLTVRPSMMPYSLGNGMVIDEIHFTDEGEECSLVVAKTDKDAGVDDFVFAFHDREDGTSIFGVIPVWIDEDFYVASCDTAEPFVIKITEKEFRDLSGLDAKDYKYIPYLTTELKGIDRPVCILDVSKYDVWVMYDEDGKPRTDRFDMENFIKKAYRVTEEQTAIGSDAKELVITKCQLEGDSLHDFTLCHLFADVCHEIRNMPKINISSLLGEEETKEMDCAGQEISREEKAWSKGLRESLLKTFDEKTAKLISSNVVIYDIKGDIIIEWPCGRGLLAEILEKDENSVRVMMRGSGIKKSFMLSKEEFDRACINRKFDELDTLYPKKVFNAKKYFEDIHIGYDGPDSLIVTIADMMPDIIVLKHCDGSLQRCSWLMAARYLKDINEDCGDKAA